MSKHNLGAIRVAVLVCAAALLLAPASALADGGGPSVTLGPIKVKHGWSVTISTGCSSRGTSTTIYYLKGTTRQSISHFYSGPRSTCTLSKSLASGKISLSWPGAAAIDVKLGNAGAMTHPAAPAGCRQKRADERSVSASGRIHISIHAGAFGTVSARHASGYAAATTGLKCKGTNTSILLSASFGSNYSMFVTGSQPSRGRGERVVTVSDATGDQPATGVTGYFDAQLLGGKSLFDAASNLTRATLHGSGPVKGSLKFTAQPACPGERNSRPGTLSGRLVVRDPVLGTLDFSGAQAAGAYMVKGNASAPTCGSAASPPTVSFSDSCGTAGACSVSGGTNTVYFGDGTLAGSTSITGETWSFGDGSAPMSTGYPGLNVQHTYATPGTYTVTLTVTAVGGEQYSSTGTVYIGS